MLTNTLKAIMTIAGASLCICACNQVTVCDNEDYVLVVQNAGPELGYSKSSGVQILRKDTFAFKDLNRNGKVDAYEDWRKSPEERADSLTAMLSVEDMAGLMLCSHMQALPGTDMNHYGGKVFRQSDSSAYSLTDEQKVFLSRDRTKSVLLAGAKDTPTIVKWVNRVQAIAEAQPLGIPANIFSDPRHHASSSMIFMAGCGGSISVWPGSLGMAATFDPSIMSEFGRTVAREYRALGITTALSPQADIPTEPRWWRFDGTYGENTTMIADMVRAYCDGLQTSYHPYTISGAWGTQSVNTMVKHWYGYGAQEGGREAHFSTGQYGIFPSDNLEAFRKTFVDGAFKLQGGTGSASAVMTNYSVLWNQDPSGENVACSYSKYVVEQKLRKESGFEGVVCTDWDVMFDYDNVENAPGGYKRNGKCYGVENLSLNERFYRILLAGVDQFGGCNDIEPVLGAYDIWAEKHGKESADDRFRASARRILLNMFRVGIFENAYADLTHAQEIVGNTDFMQRGYNAQLHSVVMLKNDNVLPRKERAKVYFPKRHFPSIPGAWGGATQEKIDFALDTAVVSKYYQIADSPAEADFAIVMINDPAVTYGYSAADRKAGGNGYVPMSLQYEDYTATDAPAVSYAGGNPLESTRNRSFKGKTIKTLNRDDMVLVQQTKAAMGSKPVVVCIDAVRPLVLSEIEPYADALLVGFCVQRQTSLDIISGAFEPCGLLPLQMPASMHAVEVQVPDKPLDIECYTDSKGNTYDFGFGLNWQGRISDARTDRYCRK